MIQQFDINTLPMEWYNKMMIHFNDALGIIKSDKYEKHLFEEEYVKYPTYFYFLVKNNEPLSMAIVQEEYSFSQDFEIGDCVFIDIVSSLGNGSGAKIIDFVLKRYEKKHIELLPAICEDWLIPYYERFGFDQILDEDDDLDYMIKFNTTNVSFLSP